MTEYAQFSLRVPAKTGKKIRSIALLKDVPTAELLRRIVETEIDRMLTDPESRADLRASHAAMEDIFGEETP